MYFLTNERAKVPLTCTAALHALDASANPKHCAPAMY